MITKNCKFKLPLRSEKGVALLFALIVLAVLTAFSYSVLMRLSARKRRLEYYIDYQKARYSSESGMKYAMEIMKTLNLEYMDRIEHPDFSDLFWMNDQDYLEFRTDWAKEIDEVRFEEFEQKEEGKTEVAKGLTDMLAMFGLGDANSLMSGGDEFVATEPNSLSIPGPYGPAWPLVVKEEILKIGDAQVVIRIEDENAKLPATLAFLDDPKLEREKKACFMTFFEWMDADRVDVDEFLDSAQEIAEIKRFDFKLKDVTVKTPSVSKKKTTTKTKRRSSRRTKVTKRPATKHYSDFAFLMASNMDIEKLSKIVIDSKDKPEDMLKYLGVKGSSKVNINSAPRHVLEAIFSFGGDADLIAEEIIIERQEEPFKDINDLKSRLLGYSDSINKVSKLLVTKSLFLSINIKATSGNATVISSTSVIKVGKVAQRIATITQ